MPECYEVKRLATYLSDNGIVGNPIVECTFHNKGERIIKNSSAAEFEDYLIGNQINRIVPYAKYTLIETGRGTMLWHYRFTGLAKLKGVSLADHLRPIYSLPVDHHRPNAVRFEIRFEKPPFQMLFIDTRCLSVVEIFPNIKNWEQLPVVARLGQDFGDWTPQPYESWKSQRKGNPDVKTWLMNQSVSPSGIGNYLACEILAQSNTYPWLRIQEVTKKQYLNLCSGFASVRQLCEANVSYDWFKVFRRTNCLKCKQVVERKRHRGASSQSTFWCPNCQAN